jgi:hypothetical protein
LIRTGLPLVAALHQKQFTRAKELLSESFLHKAGLIVPEREQMWSERECFVTVNGTSSFNNAVLTSAVSKSDPVFVVKALYLLAAAYQVSSEIRLGSSCRLSRYITLWPNQVVSDVNGDVWHKCVQDAFWPSDTPVLDIYDNSSCCCCYKVDKIESSKSRVNDIEAWIAFPALVLMEQPHLWTISSTSIANASFDDNAVTSVVQSLNSKFAKTFDRIMIGDCLKMLFDLEFFKLLT